MLLATQSKTSTPTSKSATKPPIIQSKAYTKTSKIHLVYPYNKTDNKYKT